MDDVDALVGQLTETQVDPTALGEHPRFSKFKNAGRAAEQQARRREDVSLIRFLSIIIVLASCPIAPKLKAMERQRNSRFDHFNHTRKLAENEVDEEDEIVELEPQPSDDDQPTDLRKKRYKSRYADELMLSEWLVDIPEQLSSEWMMVPSPVGKRVLVVAAKVVSCPPRLISIPLVVPFLTAIFPMVG
ncbi:unnamed protein product [Nippostrongylus brasiliensis]|uniref:Snurportin-1 n=1 Tax=Nippostrongylus brasiliensis TaxID=27835 RepID=A0A0N4XZJ2_NIPBR|nr:unnamed protein product [Nippostrongylus brasiliensis]